MVYEEVGKESRRRRWPVGVAIVLVALGSSVLGACQAASSDWSSPIQFDTATVLLYSGTYSTAILVEVARSADQRAFGLSRRPSLDPGSGMLFEFDTIQAADPGFWMWRTNIPLDIAFIDDGGVIRRILSMEVCGARAESCPSYAPGAEYATALEANLGWFDEQGIDEGDRVTVMR